MGVPRIQSKADKAVKSIIEDIRNRRGLKSEWDQIDLDVRKEIEAKWAKLIMTALNVADDAPCKEKDSRGIPCEVKGPHETHACPEALARAYPKPAADPVVVEKALREFGHEER